MATGSAWNIDDPTKPWALFDTDADVKIPIGVDDWLTSLGVGYASHEVIAAAPLECPAPGTHTPGAPILVRMRVASGASFTAGQKYPFTIRVHGDDGTTKDDRTFWLKLVVR